MAQPATDEPASPARIVSLNLCTDQLAMLLADPDQLVSVSWLAADPASSNMAVEARAFPHNRGTAEEVIALRPDLVLAGRYTTPQTRALLHRLGYRIEIFDPATNIASARANILKMGDLTGQPEKARAMVRQIDAAVAAAQDFAPDDKRPVFADYGPNGYITGNGTLMNDIIQTAGFTPLSETLGLGRGGIVSLEQLIAAAPDLIDPGAEEYTAPARATSLAGHPAMQQLLARRETLHLPDRLTACETPHFTEALAALATKRRELAEND